MVKASGRRSISCLPITSKKLKYNDLAMTNRTKAISILNHEVEKITMIGLSDLPDTAELAEYIDEIEEMFDNDEILAEILAVAREYAREFVSDEFGDFD
jgi:hypothetical protein